MKSLLVPALLVAHVRRVQNSTEPQFTVPTQTILTEAQSFFNSFSGVLAVAIGIGLGGSILYRVKNLF